MPIDDDGNRVTKTGRPTGRKNQARTRSLAQIRVSSLEEVAFRDYCELGPKRNLTLLLRVYEKWERERQEQNNSNPPPPTYQMEKLKEWAKKFDWATRAAQYDDRRKLAREVMEVEIFRNDRERWATRARAIREEAWDAGSALIAKAKAMLEFPIAKTTVEEKDGKTITTIMPMRWTAGTITDMLKLGVDLMRQASDLPDERIDVRVTQDLPQEERARAVLEFMQSVSATLAGTNAAGDGPQSVDSVLSKGADGQGHIRLIEGSATERPGGDGEVDGGAGEDELRSDEFSGLPGPDNSQDP